MLRAMRRQIVTSLVILVALSSAPPAQAAQVQVLLPLGRTLYQTNEIIDVSAVRSDARALSAGSLVMTLTGADGSKMSFTFPVRGVPGSGGEARTTEQLHLNGALLRPEKYTVGVSSDGATATTTLTVYSAVRKSTYKTVHWGAHGGDTMLTEGEGGMGFNLLLTGDVRHQEQSIAVGADVMGNALMGGGHQHDLKFTNDWSDPNVYIGAIQRGIDRAFAFRTLPNAIGAHLHDEPGLTWLTNPHTHKMSPHDIATQRAAYKGAYGHDAIWSDQVNVRDPDQYAQWTEENDFKLGFMDAFWKASKEAIGRLKPNYLVVTQSQYGWKSLFDGYYFNVARSLPIISGHGGYDDYWLRNLNPPFFLEMALPRQLDKPTWYMPEWESLMSGDELRLEHNLSFITGIQGMSIPPGITVKSPSFASVADRNEIFQKLGTIFTEPAYTNQDLTILYSKSNQYYEMKQGQPGLRTAYLATKLLQYPIQAVLEEDILDGSLAANHKAVLLVGISHLDHPIITGLEDFIRGGGVVIETGDCKVPIRGALKVSVDPTGQENADDAVQTIADPGKRNAEAARVYGFHHQLENASRIAAGLKPALALAGIKPTFVSQVPTIAAGKQVRGEIEYDFAVNFTVGPNDTPGGLGIPIATTASIALPDDGRPVYDAVTGRSVPFKSGVASLVFGPGQMYALARPARAIGGVQVGSPVLDRDYTREESPLRLDLTATLVDVQKKLLAGTAPMEVKVTDPRGVDRYDVFHDARHGVLSANFPLAANDPAGKWTVTVTELLSRTHGSATFTYHPAPQCGALAGKTAGAVVFGADVPNIFRFFRDHRNVTIVHGTGAGDAEAAHRLVEILKPYNVTATIENLSDANKARPLTDEQAATWCGDQSPGSLTGAQRADVAAVGYNLPGPTILIGNAADNPLIDSLRKRNVLPYEVTADFPGVGHGLVAWNLMTLGHDIEALALIGNDAKGMEEAVGTAFRIGIGIDPLTRFVLPVSNSVSTASGASPP
jgi:hypothetical protein